MLVIKNKQIDVFKAAAICSFEDEMIAHIKTCFPNHFIAMPPEVVRQTIQHGITHAAHFGFVTKRNVCHYINHMLVLGSNFHIDPKYSWAGKILNDKTEPVPAVRIKKLNDKTLAVIKAIAGSRHVYQHPYFKALKRHIKNLETKGSLTNIKNISTYLNDCFPRTCDVLGKMNIEQMIRMGNKNARGYQIKSEQNRVTYILFMFLMGSGFDKDPQFPWAQQVLANAETDENSKIKMLVEKAEGEVKAFHSKLISAIQ